MRKELVEEERLRAAKDAALAAKRDSVDESPPRGASRTRVEHVFFRIGHGVK